MFMNYINSIIKLIRWGPRYNRLLLLITKENPMVKFSLIINNKISALYYQRKLMHPNYQLITNPIKSPTKYDSITIVSIADYTKVAVYTYTYKLTFVKSKMFYTLPKGAHVSLP